MVADASVRRTTGSPGRGPFARSSSRTPAAEGTVRATRPLESAVWAALHDVHDPEIPTISVVDLGVIRSVTTAPEHIRVELLPTFVGCPAIDVMRSAVQERLREFADDVQVDISFAEPWTSDRITQDGHAALRQAGYAPPQTATPARQLSVLPSLPLAECPYCGSHNTTLENAFGPALCRAIYHCADCRQPFEQFKEV